MTCNQLPTDCTPTPCSDIPETPCQCQCGNIALPDGRYENATIVVEKGCITVVEKGSYPLYTPDVCCSGAGSGGGSGAQGEQGEKGEPGENATISIGTVNTLSPGSKATVRNVGSETHAIFDFGIPEGKQGESGANPNGVTKDAGGIFIQQGSIVGLPATWPPVLYLLTQSATDGVVMEATAPDEKTGMVTLSIDLNKFNTVLREYIDTQIANASSNLQTQITAINTALQSMQSTVSWIQNNCCSTV